jgi:hypothetical protein
MTLRGTRSTPTRGSATPISALRKRWYFLALPLGALAQGVMSAWFQLEDPSLFYAFWGDCLSLYPPTPRPCPSLWALEGRYGSGYDGAGQVPAHAMPRRLRAAGRDRRIEARRQHVSLPCACTGTPVPARTHRPACTRARAWRARTDKHTPARARVSATPTHALTSRHPRSHMRARTYARTRIHTQARTHAHAPMALATTRLTALPRHRYVYTSNVDGHFRRQRQSRAQSVVRGAVRPPSRQRLYAVVLQPLVPYRTLQYLRL